MGPDLGSVSDGGDLTVGFHVEAGERVGLGGCEECLLCAAAALGCVHGVVGVALQRFRIAALIGENSDADAGGAGDVAAIEGEGMTEAVFETGFIGVEVFDAFDSVGDEQELVAANAGELVGRSDLGGEPLGDLLQV